MIEREISYADGQTACIGRLVTLDNITRPGVLIAPTFAGQNAFAIERAEAIAKLGYAAFIVDLYGEGKTSTDPSVCRSWMNPLLEDRSALHARMKAAYAAANQLPEVDSKRIAAIGYCFGGLCALDMARSGLDLKGVVSFHGMFTPSPISEVKAKVLVLHGYDDPLATPEQLTAFASEMTKAGVDWQIHAFGHTGHGFTNAKAQHTNPGYGYKESSARRSWLAMQNFLEEVFSREAY